MTKTMAHKTLKNDYDCVMFVSPPEEDVDSQIEHGDEQKEAPSALVRLDDLMASQENKPTKQRLSRAFKTSLENFSDLVLTDEEANIIARHLRFLRTGLNAVVPIYCGGPGICPFERTCPFVKIKKVPVGRVCPIEADLMRAWTEAYMETFKVEPDNIVELNLVQELAELDIYDRRASFWLQVGEGQGLLQEQIVGVDQNGRPVKRLEVHQALVIKERLKARKLRVILAMMKMRQDQQRCEIALKNAKGGDPSTELAALRIHLESIRRNKA